MLQRQKYWLANSYEDLCSAVKQAPNKVQVSAELLRSNSFIKKWKPKLGRSCEELHTIKRGSRGCETKLCYHGLKKQKQRLAQSCEDLRSVVRKVPCRIQQQKRNLAQPRYNRELFAKSYSEFCSVLKDVPRKLQTFVNGN